MRDRLVVDLDQRVRAAEHVDDGRAGLGRSVEHHDARVLVAQPELALAADHAERGLAAELALLDLGPVRHACADAGEDDVLPLSDVGSAADDLQQLARAVIDLAEAELVGLGVTTTFGDMAHDEGAQLRAKLLDAFDLSRGQGQIVRDALGAQVTELDMALQPFA
jgi:hypothetical protein